MRARYLTALHVGTACFVWRFRLSSSTNSASHLTDAYRCSPTRDERYFAFVHDGDVINKTTQPALKVRSCPEAAMFVSECSSRAPPRRACLGMAPLAGIHTCEFVVGPHNCSLTTARSPVGSICRAFNSIPRSAPVIRTRCVCKTAPSRWWRCPSKLSSSVGLHRRCSLASSAEASFRPRAFESQVARLKRLCRVQKEDRRVSARLPALIPAKRSGLLEMPQLSYVSFTGAGIDLVERATPIRFNPTFLLYNATAVIALRRAARHARDVKFNTHFLQQLERFGCQRFITRKMVCEGSQRVAICRICTHE